MKVNPFNEYCKDNFEEVVFVSVVRVYSLATLSFALPLTVGKPLFLFQSMFQSPSLSSTPLFLSYIPTLLARGSALPPYTPYLHSLALIYDPPVQFALCHVIAQ